MAACALSSAVAYVVKVDGRKAWCILFDPLDTKVNACTDCKAIKLAAIDMEKFRILPN